MPIYEYQCKDCEQRFEELVLAGRRTSPGCPECSSSNVEKVYSTFAAQSNGAPSGESFSKAAGGPMCGTCGGPGPCAMN